MTTERMLWIGIALLLVVLHSWTAYGCVAVWLIGTAAYGHLTRNRH